MGQGNPPLGGKAWGRGRRIATGALAGGGVRAPRPTDGKRCGAWPGRVARGAVDGPMWASAPTDGYKRCGEVRNPPVTASPCQPPLGKGAYKDGGGGSPRARRALAMTEAERTCVSFRDQSADWSWESVIPLHKGRGERIATAGVRTGFAMTCFFARGAVQIRVGGRVMDGAVGGAKKAARRRCLYAV